MVEKDVVKITGKNEDEEIKILQIDRPDEF
jgi:hypothetical protein